MPADVRKHQGQAVFVQGSCVEIVASYLLHRDEPGAPLQVLGEWHVGEIREQPLLHHTGSIHVVANPPGLVLQEGNGLLQICGVVLVQLLEMGHGREESVGEEEDRRGRHQTGRQKEPWRTVVEVEGEHPQRRQAEKKPVATCSPPEGLMTHQATALGEPPDQTWEPALCSMSMQFHQVATLNNPVLYTGVDPTYGVVIVNFLDVESLFSSVSGFQVGSATSGCSGSILQGGKQELWEPC